MAKAKNSSKPEAGKKKQAVAAAATSTEIGNLLLTGQNINLHGICGVPLTAVNTAEALLGTNRLIHAINTKYETDHGNLCK